MVPVAVSAHAQLIGSDPAAGSTLSSPPTTVTLLFSEAVTPVGRGISVYGPDGRLAQSGSATAQGTRLAVKVTAAAEGTYAVIWTVIAADTHPSRGEFTFSVGHGGPVRAPGIGDGDIGLVSATGLFLQALGRWLHFAGFALGFGSATYALFVARDPRPLRLAATAGVVLLLLAAPVALLAQTASIDPAQTFDGDALTSTLASPFGRVLGLQMAAALVLWAILGALRQAPWLRFSIPTLGVALALVDATAAHATPALPQPLGLALNALHVSAMAMWFGGLAAFLVAPVGRFGRVALLSTGLLIASGAALALLHFSNPLQTMSTAYGGILMVKLLLVAPALYLAWRARRRGELAALTAVLAVAAVLISLPPPR